MFYSDKPINEKENDKLNRVGFSNQLARAILSYTNTDNFTIGLCGKWGTGKTSIINMTIQEILNITKEYDEDEKPIIITFNPWNYSDCTQLISQFFETIQSKIKVDETNERLNAIGNALQKYSSVFEYSSYIPVVGKYLSPIKTLLENAGIHITEKTGNTNLNDQKELVIDALKSQKQKIIVIIDDIDRLNNEQIRLIFQLVNSLASFPNMIYLLSFDREIVSRALEQEQNCNGDEYLEKIIQVPFEVPKASKTLIDDAFCVMYSDIIFNNKVLIDGFDKEYWWFVFHSCISPFVNTMRDVNRIMNAFKFKFGLMYEETNCVDLLAITTLQVCAPEIYTWIFNNKESLVGGINSISGVDQKENKAFYLKLFNDIYPQNPQQMLTILQSLFKYFSWKTGGYNPCKDEETDLMRKDKIASKERFDRYFNLSLEEITINKRQIIDTINNYTTEELHKYFFDLMHSKKLSDYLREFIAYVDDVPISRYIMFIEEFIYLETIEENQQHGFFSYNPAYQCKNCINEILKRNSKHGNFELLNSLISNANKTTFPYFCKIIIDIEVSYGRIESKYSFSDKFISEEDLVNIEKLFKDKVEELYKEDSFFEFGGCTYVVKLWKFVHKESYDNYIKCFLEEPINIPKYLCSFANIWNNSDGMNGWYFEEESFNEYITKEQAYEMILALKNTKDFNLLQFKFKEIAIAYYIWYNLETKKHEEIYKDKVDSIVVEWEQSVES